MNELLYGHSADEGIIAVHQADDSTVKVYHRLRMVAPLAPTQNDALSCEIVEFYPFFHLSSERYIQGFETASGKMHWVRKLAGANYYQYLCAFSRWADMWDGVRFAIDRYNETQNKKIQEYTEADILLLRADPVVQYLLQSGRTLFKGMQFDDVHRMQLQVETYSRQGYQFGNPERSEDRVIIIAASDNRGWEQLISGKAKSEGKMLEELIRIINERDPDVIEGHNIFSGLFYVLKRCELHKIDFAIGRDGSVPHHYTVRTSFAERDVEYVNFEVNARHVIDTWLLLQSYDVSKRSLPAYDLQAAAQHFGLVSQERTYTRGERIAWYWDNDPEILIRQARDDTAQIRQLSEYLSMSTFYLTQMLPFNYGQTARIGAATKIESFLLREYIHLKHSLPHPEEGTQSTGGYTDIFHTGVFCPIVHADVESLYPSIMIKQAISPKTDELGIFTALLKGLTSLRLEAKTRMKEQVDPNQKARYDATQSSFKILINAFYGYLGYSRGLFNDYEEADRVTQTGQEILRQMIDEIQSEGCTVLEVDTDGILFVPPKDTIGEEPEREFVERLSNRMPEGINIGFDGRYKKMLSYRKKNYALLGYDNKVKLKGSSLISRSMERFGRNYVQECIDCLLNSNIDGLHRLYVNLHKDIQEHKLTARDFARTESLKDSIEEYERDVGSGNRNRSASYEAAKASGRQYRIGDRVSYYITGTDASIRSFEHSKLAEEWDPNFPDENVGYYLKRLDEFSEKFKIFFTPQDFHRIFSIEDLFGFSAEGIQSIVTEVKAEEEVKDEKMEGGELERTL